MPSPTRSAPRVLGPARDRRGRLRTPAILGANVVLFALGLAAGHLSAPGGRGVRAEPSDPPLSPDVGVPPRSGEATVQIGEHTREGAARSAARALSSFADPRLIASRQARRTAVAAFARPAYRAQLDPLFDRTYGYLGRILGTPARDGDVVLTMAPVGYRVEAYSRRQATVAVWQVTLLATSERAPIAAWSTSRAELAWSRGRWRVERFGTDVPGPAPSVTAPATTAGPSDFVAAAHGFSPFVP